MPISANIIEQAFSPLISLFESIMVFIHAHLVGGSWGLAIVGLTVLVRAILVPVTFRQLKSMQEMQRLAPEMKAIKDKYAEDKQRQQQEIMKFYKENKINPLASCLPFALQLPVCQRHEDRPDQHGQPDDRQTPAAAHDVGVD